jgi:hypothetical protein
MKPVIPGKLTLFKVVSCHFNTQPGIPFPRSKFFFEMPFLVNSTLTDRDPGTGLEIPVGFKITHPTGMTALFCSWQ